MTQISIEKEFNKLNPINTTFADVVNNLDTVGAISVPVGYNLDAVKRFTSFFPAQIDEQECTAHLFLVSPGTKSMGITIKRRRESNDTST